MLYFKISRFICFSLFIFCVVSIFYSCHKPASENPNTGKDSSFLYSDSLVVETENPQISAFRAIIQQLDSSKAESATVAISEFKRAFTGKSAGLCDSAYVVFQELMDTVELKLNLKLQNDTTDYLPLFVKGNTPSNLQKAKADLQKNGFKFGTSEGVVYIIQDRRFVNQHMLPMVSEPMKAYLLQIEKENREGFMDDAAIVISPRQHVDRILWYEKFISDYPDFLLIKNCKLYKKAYLTYLMTGIDNTYLYESEQDMKLSAYFVQAYSYLLKNYPDSETSNLILPYMQAIEQKQKSVVDELLKKYVIKGLIYSQGI